MIDQINLIEQFRKSLQKADPTDIIDVPAGLPFPVAQRVAFEHWDATHGAIKLEPCIPDAELPRIRLAVAKAEPTGLVKLNLVIEGKTEEFTVARHVAASMIAALSRALANSA